MAYEMKKATERRFNEDPDFWDAVFVGEGIDVGCGPDPMVWEGASVLPFDKEQGDGSRLSAHFPESRFDFVVSSQFIEHTNDPIHTLRQMISITKKGGWVIATCPEFLIYEGGKMPSRWNPDHRCSFSLLTRQGAPKFPHIFVPDLRKTFQPHSVCASLEHDNWDFMDLSGKDQTWEFEDRVEGFIEICIQKSL